MNKSGEKVKQAGRINIFINSINLPIKNPKEFYSNIAPSKSSTKHLAQKTSAISSLLGWLKNFVNFFSG